MIVGMTILNETQKSEMKRLNSAYAYLKNNFLVKHRHLKKNGFQKKIRFCGNIQHL